VCRVKTGPGACTFVRLADASQNVIVSGQWFVESDSLQIQPIVNSRGTAMTKADSIHNAQVGSWLALAAAAWLLPLGLVSNASSTVQKATISPLLTTALSLDESKELSLITVEYPPGGSTPAHTHHAQALLYVLEGSIVMQVRGGASVTLSPGQTWYEGPDDVHIVSRNASSSRPAKYVVFMVKDKGAPLLKHVE
jgi:quercetin dioxygenase-like cupin family protein